MIARGTLVTGDKISTKQSIAARDKVTIACTHIESHEYSQCAIIADNAIQLTDSDYSVQVVQSGQTVSRHTISPNLLQQHSLLYVY